MRALLNNNWPTSVFNRYVHEDNSCYYGFLKRCCWKRCRASDGTVNRLPGAQKRNKYMKAARQPCRSSGSVLLYRNALN